MIKKEFKLNRSFDSRLVALFVQKASTYGSTVFVEKGNKRANGKSLLGVLSLGLLRGTSICLIATGEDEKLAIRDLGEYLLRT